MFFTFIYGEDSWSEMGRFLQESAARFGIEVHAYTDRDRALPNQHIIHVYENEALRRIQRVDIMQRLLDKHKRVTYLDADFVFIKNPQNVFDNLGEFTLAASPELVKTAHYSLLGDTRVLPPKPFNTGFISATNTRILDLWRETHLAALSYLYRAVALKSKVCIDQNSFGKAWSDHRFVYETLTKDAIVFDPAFVTDNTFAVHLAGKVSRGASQQERVDLLKGLS